MSAVTKHTITDKCALLEELQRIGIQGWAADMEESCLGLRCVGAPIMNPLDKVEGAIGISGPIFRMSREQMQVYAKAVMQEASHISQLLGAQ
jgi:IclR family acetate operon transcriptional repressor